MQQPQYYKTVRASERLPEKDQEVFIIGYLRSDKGFIRREWCDLQNSWFIRVYTKGLDESGKDDLLTSFREGHKSINSIAWLEPIQLPDAALLRSALEKIADILTPAIRIELSHHDMMKRLHTIAREAISGTSDGWVRVDSDKPPTNTMVDGYNPAWIDEDYNPEGIRECFLEDEGYWVSAQWNNTHDGWDADDVTAPTHWRQRPSPPQNK